MQSIPMVYRCQACGAPVRVISHSWSCDYCGSENVLVPDVGPILKAAEEAREMVPWVQERLAVINKEMESVLAQMQAGAWELERRFLVLQEASLRLTYAPTVHMLKAQDPSEPHVARAWGEIDGVVAEVLENWRVAFVGMRETLPTPADP